MHEFEVKFFEFFIFLTGSKHVIPKRKIRLGNTKRFLKIRYYPKTRFLNFKSVKVPHNTNMFVSP